MEEGLRGALTSSAEELRDEGLTQAPEIANRILDIRR